MIDWTRVMELHDEIGAQEFNEVVDLFLEEVEGVISRLRTDPQPSLFEEDLHFLKGCAMNLGFADFSSLCLAGETTSANGAPEDVNVAPILACYTDSRARFLRGIADGQFR